MREEKESKEAYNLVLFHETPRAYLVGLEPEANEDENAFWLPKSQVEVDQFVRSGGVEWAEFRIPMWLAEEKGLDFSLDGVLE